MIFRPLSHVEQLVAHLKSEVLRGRWTGEMPGVFALERELGVSHTIIDRALRQLEGEGVLAPNGKGRRRRIVLARESAHVRMRVRLMVYEKRDIHSNHLIELLHQLKQAGHDAAFAGKTMYDLGMDVRRIARFVGDTETDAWIVVAGPRDVLEWFARQPMPVFALFGSLMDVAITGAALQKTTAIAELLERLVGMGHRRIVNIVREDRRQPQPGYTERFFLEQLSRHGIETGPYHLPDWGDSPEALARLLDALFQHTPPTALILDEPSLFVATRDHLAHKGLLAPEHVSLVCSDFDRTFDWCRPPVTHIVWQARPMISAVVKWLDQLSSGQDRHAKTLHKARLVRGGTIGPAPKT